jgi:hypothetical protein
MTIKKMELHLTKDELYKMIDEDNPDKKDIFKGKILYIIKYFEYFSVKQYKWILSKIIFIPNHNKKYKNIRKKFIDFEIDENL